MDTQASGQPVNMPPQVMIHAQEPPRRGRGWKIFGILAMFLLLVSLAGNLLLFIGLAMSAAGREGGSETVAEEVIHSGGSERIVVLPAVGTVDGEMAERVRKYCDYIKNDKSIKAIVVEVDSPGGTITASDEIFHRLTQLRGQKNVPMVVSMRSIAASGGYYMSMAADTLYAEPTTMTGSIGVIWPAFEFSELMSKVGVTPEIITSDQAVFKDAASPFKRFTDRDREYIKGLVNDAHVRFRKIVEEGRKGKLRESINKIAVGRVWTATDALRLGLIDEIAYQDDVFSKVAGAAGISDPTVVRLKERHGLLEIFGASGQIAKPKIEIDPKMFFELSTPRMQYRWVAPMGSEVEP